MRQAHGPALLTASSNLETGLQLAFAMAGWSCSARLTRHAAQRGSLPLPALQIPSVPRASVARVHLGVWAQLQATSGLVLAVPEVLPEISRRSDWEFQQRE